MTAIAPNCWSESDQKAIREQLVRIINSAPLHQSQRRQRFLEYLVNEALAGRGERLKGYNVALEVFDRPETFDSGIDPIVRIEAARLREKLREYYEVNGQSDPIRIELPKGSYTPHIEFRQAPTRDPRPDRPEATAQDRRLGPIQGSIGQLDGRPTLAVLPFANMSASRETDFLADGFTDALITDLAKVSGLFVISRQSSFAHRHSTQPLPEIAAALRVRYLIEGSVHTEEERIRISANLIDTASDHSLWAERYEKNVRDFFAVQDEVCRSIVRALRVKLTPSETARIVEVPPIALWEEDWSRLKIRIDQLRNAGVTDFRRYLRENPAIQPELVKLVRWKGFNDAAIDLYRADNQHALEQYLSPAPVTAFAAYPEAIASFLEGRRYVGIDTVDRAVDGTELRIIETFQLPRECDPDWSSVMSSSQDIANLKQAELAVRQTTRRRC